VSGERAASFARPGYRERLIDAMAISIEEKGYKDTFVADIVRIARTSRRSFYEQFEDREACYLAVFDAASDALIEQIAAAVAPEQRWEQQVDDALGAYLEAMASRPALWQSFLREIPALGRDGATRRRAVIERFAETLIALVEAGRRVQPELDAHPLAHDMAIMIVGGMGELVTIALDEGRDPRALRPVAAQTIKAILSATVLQHQA
jgi:AcrR family transcriptional regulator